MLKIGDFQHFFNFFFNIFFSTFFALFELALQCSLKWSLVARLFLCKWASYRGFTAAKIVHLITEIAGIQKFDPYRQIHKLYFPLLFTLDYIFTRILVVEIHFCITVFLLDPRVFRPQFLLLLLLLIFYQLQIRQQPFLNQFCKYNHEICHECTLPNSKVAFRKYFSF